MGFKLVTPHAAILIWNYDDRVNADGGKENLHRVEPVIIGTSSVISISTAKRKSSPAGSFEIRLAPRFNWVTRITPGSWCVIMMSQDQLPNMSKNNVGTARPESFKMLGRIDSVRGVVEVNQETGARSTVFVVTGQDWGSVFESILYIDQGVAENIFKGSAIAQAYSILGLNMYQSFADKKQLPTSSDLINAIIDLWGLGAGTAIANGEELIKEASKLVSSQLLLSTKTQFQLPYEVAKYMGQNKTAPGDSAIGTTAINFAQIIHREHGRLTKYDDPKQTGLHYTRVQDAYGIPSPSQFLGAHSLWQLMSDNCNSTLYELVNDIRWSGNGKPVFTLYHRIKPFVTRDIFMESYTSVGDSDPAAAKATVDSLVSPFKHVRRANIPLADVININFGTNWRDKINFIEVRASTQLLKEVQGLQAKLDGQTLDRKGYERDGFKPYFATSSFLPIENDASLSMIKLSHWKLLLREWYFNTHMMLNGSVTFIGQNQYIQVGDNIMIDSAVLGDAPTNAGQKEYNGASKNTFLLAHVENIMHNFSVNPETGARTFSTTVQFVRGILTDSSGKTVTLRAPAPPESGAIDRSATPLSPVDERNKNAFGVSVPSDPDAQKLGKDGLV